VAINNALVRNYGKHLQTNRKKHLDEDTIIELVPLVKRIAIKVKNQIYSPFTIDDLFSIAIVAVTEAATKIDSSDKEKFRHYLLKRAKGAIYDELRKEDFLSRSSREFLDAYEDAWNRLYDCYDRDPSYEEIAEFLGISEDKLIEELRKTETTGFFSLDSWFSREDGSSSFDDVVAGNSPIGEDKVGELDIQGEILKSLDKLAFQERLVLSFYYYDELNFKEIALVMGVTVGRVSQLHTKAIQRLRKLVEKSVK